ncbi:hypothetical protein [Desulfoluna sp.]|uniref:hypothetical protein n=1 Tax=Desulfoluna sp. TaxID=2045199 RepID=UPI002634E5A2|nr:hypothetical protein [Desulfoluna sp.]
MDDEEGNRITGLSFGNHVDVEGRVRRAHRLTSDKPATSNFVISVQTGLSVCVTLNGAGSPSYGLKRFCETFSKKRPVRDRMKLNGYKYPLLNTATIFIKMPLRFDPTIPLSRWLTLPPEVQRFFQPSKPGVPLPSG